MVRAQSIERGLREAIDSVMLRRGEEYFAEGAVKDIRYSAAAERELKVVATVQGTTLYHTELTINTATGDTMSADCSCPYFNTNEAYCKHAAALGYALIAQVTKVFPDGIGDVLARDIAESLQKDVAPTVSAKKASRPKPFRDRYAVLLRTRRTGVLVHVFDRSQLSEQWTHTNALLARAPMIELLGDRAVVMSDEERALLKYLSTHDAWMASFDSRHVLGLVRDTKLPVYRDTVDEKHRMHFSAESRLPVPLALSLQDAVGNPHFECAMLQSDKYIDGLSIGVSGFVYVAQDEIVLVEASAEVYAIVGRLVSSARHASAGTIPMTALSDDEALRINEIIPALAAACQLTTTLTPDFHIEHFEGAQPALLVDYDATAARIVVHGAVDYGCDVLDVSQMWRAQTHYGYAAKALRPIRNVNAQERPRIVAIKGTQIGWTTIDVAKEEAVYRELFDAHGCNKSASAIATGHKNVEKFLSEHWNGLVALKWKLVFLKDDIRYVTSDVRTDMNVDLDAQKDWLAFDLALYCGDERVRLEDVITYIQRGDECLKTEDGRMIRVTNRADLERLVRMLERFSQNKAGKFEGRLYNAPEVADVASNNPHYRAQFANSFDAFMQEAKSGKPIEPVVLPASHEKLLRPYQTSGVEWLHFLRRHRFGGILADEMGLGKTIQALSHISVHTTENDSSLVVCPKTLLHNWEREARTRFPELTVAVIEGTAAERKALILQTEKTAQLYITSYPLVQRDIEWYKMRSRPFHYLLLDEAQSIKNPRTKNAHAVKAVPAEYRLALTGTPLENSVEEIWSIFDFLMPGFLGHHASFQKHFGRPIMEEGDKDALAHLKAKTGVFMLRRTKGDVLKELPPKIEQTLEVVLGDAQNVLYQAVLAQTRTELFAEVEKRGFKRAQIHILAALTRLRQICNHPSLVEPEGEYTSAKLEACLEIVREIQAEGRKVLVFSQFTGMLDIIADALKAEKIPYSLLTGQTEGRQELVDTFNATPSIPVFLISLKAGGTGLNLTSADAVVIFDPWWNPAAENQAIDRTHRIGQKKTVNVYRLITSGTIEEKILQLQSKKRALFDALVDENGELFKKLTWDDVQSLFRDSS